MKSKVIMGIVLTLLLVGMLAMAFAHQSFSKAIITNDYRAPHSNDIRGVEWNRTYGREDYDWASSVQQTSDGGYIVAGGTSGSFGAGFDAWLVKTDSGGNAQWNKTYGGNWSDSANSVVQTGDGGYAFAGVASSFGGGGWLVKTDVNGNMQWNKTYGGNNFVSIVQTSDNGYAMAGYDYSPSSSADFFLVRTDASGNELWNRTYGGTESDRANAMIQTSDGGYAIAGSTRSSGAGSADIWLVKTDASGNMEWDKTYGDEWFESALSIVQTIDGGYAMAGSTEMLESGFYLVKTDSAGNSQWTRIYGGGTANGLVQADDEGYALVGDDFRFVKTDSSGNLKWDQAFGGGSARSILQADDGAYVIAGSTSYYGVGNGDLWLIKYSPTRVHNVDTELDYFFIQDAVSALETQEGHTIRVDADTYYENVAISKKNLTVVAENPNTTVIDGSGIGNVVTITASNVAICNFTVQHSGSQGNDSGIFLDKAGNLGTLSGNILANNNYGISLFGFNNILTNNSMVGNKYNFRAVGIQDVDTSNTVDGKPIHYLVGRQDMEVVSDAGYVALINSHNITVRGLELKNNEHGVALYNTTNSLIADNNLTKNRFGVYLYYLSDNNTVSDNSITDNEYGVGVATLGKVVVEQNRILGNSESGIIIIGESSVLIRENIIKLNHFGISTDGSPTHSGIAVVGNTILGNNGAGIYVYNDVTGYCSLYNVTFSSNNISSNGGSGIYVYLYSSNSGYSDLYNVTFSSNNISSNGGSGIALSVRGFGAGAWPMGQGHGYIRNVMFSSNTVSANDGDGIYLYSFGVGDYDYGYSYIYNVTLSSNTLSRNGGSGMFLRSESTGWGYYHGEFYGNLYNVTLSSNTVLANDKNGIHLYSYGDAHGYLYNVTLSSNTVSANSENGLLAEAQDHLVEFDLAMSNNTVSSNHQKGIWIKGGINAKLTYNSISYNTHGVFYSTSTDNSAKYNDIYRNSYGMNVTTGATVNATYNYWGDTSGPYHESLNVNGSGNPVNGNGVDLDFIPFLTNPVGDINERPVAALTADKTLVTMNQTVTFDASASTDDERIDYYFFDFGDGRNSGWTTSPMVVHNYTSRGLYNATITVMDNLGATSADDDLMNVTIRVVACPVADFTFSPEFPIVDTVVDFNASASYYIDGIIESYRWDFGDGNVTTVTAPIIAHVYTAQGTYTLNLTVTCNDQFTDSIERLITVWSISSAITLDVDSTRVVVESNLTINGILTPSMVDSNVTISYKSPDGVWAILGTVETDNNSQYTYTWTTTIVGMHEFQASWSGFENISPARSDVKAVTFYDRIYIRPDGSVYPSKLPVQQVGNVYTLTGNVSVGIVVEKDNIVIEGAKYTVRRTSPINIGINLSGRSNVTVKKVKVTGFEYGFYLSSSNDNMFFGNTIIDSYYEGILLYNSKNNWISGNNLANNRYGIFFDQASNYNTASGNNITSSYYGGIFASESSNNSIIGNMIANSTHHGILISLLSHYHNIHKNIITGCSYGITAWSGGGNATICGNSITDCSRGIYLETLVPSTISGNTIANNNIAIYLDYVSSNNKIFHNNFVNNTLQVFNRYQGSTNTWDDGYPSGGNYWSDYNGTDLFHGPNQNVTGSDGIGDSPFVIDSGNNDSYPLMSPITFFEAGTWNEVTYLVQTVSNSTVSNFNFSTIHRMISLNVTGPDGTIGFSRVGIPKELLYSPNPMSWVVRVNGTLVPFRVLEEIGGNYTYIYFTYDHSIQSVQITGTEVIPEFPASLILPLFMVATLLAVVHVKKRKKQ